MVILPWPAAFSGVGEIYPVIVVIAIGPLGFLLNNLAPRLADIPQRPHLRSTCSAFDIIPSGGGFFRAVLCFFKIISLCYNGIKDVIICPIPSFFVEDDPRLCAELTALLERYGYLCRAAEGEDVPGQVLGSAHTWSCWT